MIIVVSIVQSSEKLFMLHLIAMYLCVQLLNPVIKVPIIYLFLSLKILGDLIDCKDLCLQALTLGNVSINRVLQLTFAKAETLVHQSHTVKLKIDIVNLQIILLDFIF